MFTMLARLACQRSTYMLGPDLALVELPPSGSAPPVGRRGCDRGEHTCESNPT